jgi:hypothetical protein
MSIWRTNEHDHLEKVSADEASSDADEDDDPEDLEEGQR